MKVLLKLQLKSLLYRMKRQQSGSKRMPGWGMVALMGFLAVWMEVILVTVWLQMSVFCSLGMEWLYFALAGLMAFAFSVFGSVFMTQSQLYDAKDNALLLSMPIRPGHILMSRMLILLLMTAVYAVGILVPAFIVYAVLFGATVSMIVSWLAVTFGVILLSQAVCCVLGWGLHWVLQHVRNKAVFSFLYMVLFLAVYFYIYGGANTFLSQAAEKGAELAEKIESGAWPIYALGVACTGDLLYSLVILIVCVGSFALACGILSRFFTKTVVGGSQGGGIRRMRAVRRKVRVKSPIMAVCHKELRKFVTSPVYLTNCGIGLLLLVALPAAAWIFRDKLAELLAVMPVLQDAASGIMILPLAFCIATTIITAPSISLEGKSLWVIRSLPVSGRTVLLGKLLLHILLVAPAAFVCALALGAALGCGVLETILAAVICAVFGILIGEAGLLLNLMMPRFDWSNEAGPCKQSAPVALTMFGGYAAIGVFAAIYALLFSTGLPGAVSLAACILVLAAVTVLLHMVLIRWGSKRFETL